MIESKKKESESFEHIKIKDFFYDNLSLDNQVKTIKLEYSIGNRIADVYCKLENGKEVVIEIQHSMILSKDLLQRTKNTTNIIAMFYGFLTGVLLRDYQRSKIKYEF